MEKHTSICLNNESQTEIPLETHEKFLDLHDSTSQTENLQEQELFLNKYTESEELQKSEFIDLSYTQQNIFDKTCKTLIKQEEETIQQLENDKIKDENKNSTKKNCKTWLFKKNFFFLADKIVSEKETITQLENCLNSALQHNDKIQKENEKLQHSLMALENENESIGEYVALYRFQRSNIQKKITEKELDLLKLQQYCQFYEV